MHTKDLHSERHLQYQSDTWGDMLGKGMARSFFNTPKTAVFLLSKLNIDHFLARKYEFYVEHKTLSTFLEVIYKFSKEVLFKPKFFSAKRVRWSSIWKRL